MLTDLLQPWRESRTWWALCHVCLDPIVGTLTFTIVVTLLSLSLGLAVTLPLALPFAWLLLVVARGLGRLERTRLHALLGLDLRDPHVPPSAGTWWRRLVEQLGSASRWREVGYLLVLLPLGCVTFALTIASWSAGAAAAALPAYVSSLPEGRAELGLFEVGQGAGAALASLLGAGLLLAAPWVTRGLARLDGWVASSLLAGRSRIAELSAQRNGPAGGPRRPGAGRWAGRLLSPFGTSGGPGQPGAAAEPRRRGPGSPGRRPWSSPRARPPPPGR